MSDDNLTVRMARPCASRPRLGGQFRATLRPAIGEDPPAGAGRHARPETVPLGAPAVVRLVRPLHDYLQRASSPAMSAAKPVDYTALHGAPVNGSLRSGLHRGWDARSSGAYAGCEARSELREFGNLWRVWITEDSCGSALWTTGKTLLSADAAIARIVRTLPMGAIALMILEKATSEARSVSRVPFRERRPRGGYPQQGVAYRRLNEGEQALSTTPLRQAIPSASERSAPE